MSTLLWAVLLLLAVGVVGFYLLSRKQKGPFEIINNISVFFDDVKSKIEELYVSVKTAVQLIDDLRERISKILDHFKSAEQQRADAEARIKEHLTDHVNAKFDELKAGLDQQTERIFNGLDHQRKVMVTEVTKAVTPAPVQKVTLGDALDTAKKLDEPPKIDPTKSSQQGFVAETAGKDPEPAAPKAPAKTTRGRKK